MLAATVALAVAFMLLMLWSNLPRTTYAEGFSTAAFQAIQPGDTEEAVLRRLGPPLQSYSAESVEQWCFEAPTTGQGPPLVTLLGLPSPDECLSIEKGVVVSVRSNDHGSLMPLLRKSVAEAERRLGRPKYILPPGPKRVLRYSTPRDVSANYEAHEVLLDGARIVRATDSYLYLD